MIIEEDGYYYGFDICLRCYRRRIISIPTRKKLKKSKVLICNLFKRSNKTDVAVTVALKMTLAVQRSGAAKIFQDGELNVVASGTLVVYLVFPLVEFLQGVVWCLDL